MTLKLVESGLGLSSGMIWGMDLHVCGLSRRGLYKVRIFPSYKGWNCCIHTSKVENLYINQWVCMEFWVYANLSWLGL